MPSTDDLINGDVDLEKNRPIGTKVEVDTEVVERHATPVEVPILRTPPYAMRFGLTRDGLLACQLLVWA
jgi:hypothetical protein